MNNIHVRFLAAALVALSLLFSAPAFGQALEERPIEFYEFIDRYVSLDGSPETPENRVEVNNAVYIAEGKRLRYPGFCALPQFTAICAELSDPASYPDYDGLELPLIRAMGRQDPTYYQSTGKYFLADRLGTPGTVAFHRVHLKQAGNHTFVATSDRFNGLDLFEVIAAFPDLYNDDGASFAVKPVLANFILGKLPISQACGGEKQTGRTPLLRVWNGRPDTGHWMTTRTDDAWLSEHRESTPGWEFSVLDIELTNREAGISCVPSISDKLVQSTVAYDFVNGFARQMQTHDISNLEITNNEIHFSAGHSATEYLTNTQDYSLYGRFAVMANSNEIAVTRALGGVTVYGATPAQEPVSFPKSSSPQPAWSATAISEETGVIYGTSIDENGIIVQAYDPKKDLRSAENPNGPDGVVWTVDLPEPYKHSYTAGESDLQFAGKYLVTYLQYRTPARDDFRSALVIFGNLSGATPEVQIIDLPGPNDLITDFSFNAKGNVGYFINAKGSSLYTLDFSNWSLSEESLPFRPFAVMANTDSGELYATEVTRLADMSYTFDNGKLWKRPLGGDSDDWSVVGPTGRESVELFMANVQGKPMVVVFNRTSPNAFQTLDFFDLETGFHYPTFVNDIFSGQDWQRGIDVSSLRQ